MIIACLLLTAPSVAEFDDRHIAVTESEVLATMSEYRDEKNHVIRIVQITIKDDKDREERERELVEELHAIFEKK